MGGDYDIVIKTLEVPRASDLDKDEGRQSIVNDYPREYLRLGGVSRPLNIE